ncbi:MAG: hypothetical protein JW987_05825 [Anaerolineaceae bacterium]|nr:hypothetical protein [Anaerolineaceae bacterium]
MNDIMLNLIVLAAFVVIGAVIFVWVRSRQVRTQKALAQMALERGWKIETLREPLAWGTRISSPRWTLTALSRSSGQESGPGSTDVSMTTTWSAPTPSQTFFIGERRSQMNSPLVESGMRTVLQMALGAEAQSLQKAEIGSDAFQQRYLVMAQRPEELSLPSAMQSILLNWKGTKPLIKGTAQGVTIELQGTHLRKPEEISALVQLGEMFL